MGVLPRAGGGTTRRMTSPPGARTPVFRAQVVGRRAAPTGRIGTGGYEPDAGWGAGAGSGEGAGAGVAASPSQFTVRSVSQASSPGPPLARSKPSPPVILSSP